jgi:CRISPR system Cascade subunit CasD
MLLDAPMQSWGFSSRFQRRTTGLHPTKSGIVGMICAAMGLDKYAGWPSADAVATERDPPSERDERAMLMRLSVLNMTTIVIPRMRTSRSTGARTELPVLRLEDYHTVQGTRKASDPTGGKADPTATVLTHRQYLLDAKFGVILSGDKGLLERVAEALRNPTWGIWFGRKHCIPAEPVCRGVFNSLSEAEKELLGDEPLDHFTRIEESAFTDGTDTWSDAPPASYGDMRPWAVRRICQQVGASSASSQSSV